MSGRGRAKGPESPGDAPGRDLNAAVPAMRTEPPSDRQDPALADERPSSAGMPGQGDDKRGAEDSPSWWQWMLGHHPRSQWDRCYVLRLGARQIPLCARCLGLYPAMILALFLGVITGAQVPVWLLAAMLGLGFVDWSLTRIGYLQGANFHRTLTGALAGAALGWAVGARLPLWLAPNQWRVVFVATLAAAMVELAALRMD